MDSIEIERRVTYHPPNGEAITRHGLVRNIIAEAMKTISTVVPDCREQSVALTKIEEAMFWANAGIARNHDLLT